MSRLGLEYYQQPAMTLAPALLGAVLVRRFRGREHRVRIVETEAYVGAHDLACHASKGRTTRTETMFASGGRTYVYLIYGMYHMLNIVASGEGDPQAVLLRGAVSLEDEKLDLIGPGKLARHLHITRVHNNLLLDGDAIYLEADAGYRPQVSVTRRIGIDYAKEWKDELLRFIDVKHVIR